MNRDEFVALPSALLAGLIWDAGLGTKLKDTPAVKPPIAPKYDSRVSRKGGQYCFVSELDLDSVRFFHKRAQDGAKNGGEYAERNAKDAENLGYWLRYRECYPDAIWSGERNKEKVTAAPPSRDPKTYSWDAKGDKPLTPPRSSAPLGDDFGDDPDGIPF